jgi:hypothetical protein
MCYYIMYIVLYQLSILLIVSCNTDCKFSNKKKKKTMLKNTYYLYILYSLKNFLKKWTLSYATEYRDKIKNIIYQRLI